MPSTFIHHDNFAAAWFDLLQRFGLVAYDWTAADAEARLKEMISG